MASRCPTPAIEAAALRSRPLLAAASSARSSADAGKGHRRNGGDRQRVTTGRDAAQEGRRGRILADDLREGRGVGTAGIDAAADYMRFGVFREAGAQARRPVRRRLLPAVHAHGRRSNPRGRRPRLELALQAPEGTRTPHRRAQGGLQAILWRLRRESAANSRTCPSSSPGTGSRPRTTTASSITTITPASTLRARLSRHPAG